MPFHSATNTIRNLNGQNKSGAIGKPALDALKQLESINGNPTMVQSVGAGALAGIMKGYSNSKSKKSPLDKQQANTANQEALLLQAEEFEKLQREIAELIAEEGSDPIIGRNVNQV
jgi:hypothetical protein